MLRQATAAERWSLRIGTREASLLANLPALAVLVSAAVAFTWFLHEALVKLDAMQASAWDLGFDQQVVWNIANGHNFYSSFAHSNFLGDHFEPVLVIPAAIERFWPDPRVLLILGCLGLAATAPAAYAMLRALLGDAPKAIALAAALAAPIPYWASTQQAARDDFHPENMALALAMLAVWAGLRGRRVLMWVLVVLVLACKEDQVYTIGVAGLVLAAQGSTEVRRQGRWVIGAAVTWLVVMVGLVQNAIRLATRSGIAYQLVSTGGHLPTASKYYYYWLLHATPGQLAAALANRHGWEVLVVMIASMCFLPLLRPRWLLLVAPPFFANLLSDHVPQAQLVLHYALLPMFPLIVAGGLGAATLLRVTAPSTAVLLAMAAPPMVLGYIFGSLPPGHMADLRPYSVADARAELRRAAAFIPADAAVAADDGVTPWLAARVEIHGFPGRGDAEAYVVIDREAYVPPGSWKIEHDTAEANLATSGRRLLFDGGRLQVWSPVP